jgi:hypothetical protein
MNMMGKILLGAVSAVAMSAVAVLGLAGPAHADQFDFVNALDNAGITYPDGSISEMIDIGKAVCHDLRSGTSPGLVASKLGKVGYSGYEQGTIMGAAANGMCSDTWPELNAWAHAATSRPPADDGDSPVGLA